VLESSCSKYPVTVVYFIISCSGPSDSCIMIKKAITIVERNRKGLERHVSENKQILWIPSPYMKWLIPQNPWTLLLTANTCSGCSASLAIKLQVASTSSWEESAGPGSKSWMEALQDSQPCRRKFTSMIPANLPR